MKGLVCPGNDSVEYQGGIHVLRQFTKVFNQGSLAEDYRPCGSSDFPQWMDGSEGPHGM